MNIFVTGAAGFIGSHLTEMCVEKGYDVVAFDTDKDGRYDLWHHDQNENSIPDLTIKHDKEKGIDVWYYDSNEDEETERVGLDTNLDGLVDEFVEI